MSETPEPTRRRIDVEQDEEDAQEDAREALLERAGGRPRDAWIQLKREMRVAIRPEEE